MASGTFNTRAYRFLMWDETGKRTMAMRDDAVVDFTASNAHSGRLAQLKVSEIYADNDSKTKFFVGTTETLTVKSAGVDVAGDLVISGNLTVSGTTTTVDATNLLIEDPLMVLSSGATGSAAVDAGFVVERGDDTNVALMWDESSDQWALISTTEVGTTAGNVSIADYGNLRLGALTVDDTITCSSSITAAAGSGFLFGSCELSESGSALLLGNNTTRAPSVQQMTSTQRDALTARNGMMIYNTTTSQLEGYDTGWGALGSGGSVPGTDNLSFEINQDNTSEDEDPFLLLTGGDGTTEKHGYLRWHAGNEEFELYSDDNGTSIKSVLNLNPKGNATDLDSALYFNGNDDAANITYDAGTYDLVITGGNSISAATNFDAEAGLDVSGGALTVTNQAITQSTGGQVTFAGNVDAGAGLDVAGGALTLSGGAATLTANAASSLTTSSGALLLHGASGINIGTTADVAVDFDAAAMDIDCSGAYTLDAAGVSIDAASASNLTTSAGALTLDGAAGISIIGNAAEVDLTTTGALDLNSGAGTWDASTLSLDSTGNTNMTLSADSLEDKTFTISASNVGTGDGFITIDGDAALYLKSTSGGVVVEENWTFATTAISGTDLSIDDAGTFTIDGDTSLVLGSAAGAVDINASGAVTVDGSSFSLDSTSTSNVTVTGDALTVGTVTSGELTLLGASGVSIAGSTLDISMTGDTEIDSAGTISIGTSSDGSAISIGHTTSEVTINDNLTVTGDLTVNGSQTFADATTIQIGDTLIELATDNTANVKDLGWYAKYNDGSAKKAGVYYDASASEFKMASELGTETDGVLAAPSEYGKLHIGELDADGAANIAGAATLEDSLDVDGATTLDQVTIDTTDGAFAVSGANAISLASSAASSFDVTSAQLQLKTTTAGELDITAAGLLDINAAANMDIDVTGTYDMLASSTFSIDGTGASNVTATSGDLTVKTATTGSLILDGVDGVSLKENGEDVIAIDTNRDVLFGQTGGSSGDPDVEIDGYFQVDGTAEFNAKVQMDAEAEFNSDMDINEDMVIAEGKEIRWEGYTASDTDTPSNNDLFYIVEEDSTMKARKVNATETDSSVDTARCAGIWRTGDEAVLVGECLAGVLDAQAGCSIGDRLYASPDLKGALTPLVPSNNGEFVTKVGIARSTASASATIDFVIAIEDPLAL